MADLSFRVVVCLALALACTPLCAADKFKQGDEVEALHNGSWLPGTVESVDRRGLVSVDFEVDGQNQREAFKPANVRPAWESGALSPARLWSDATGKFRIKAVLLSVSGDEVTLRKPDGSEVKLSAEKLSKVDRKLVAELAKTGPAPRAPVPGPKSATPRPGAGNNGSVKLPGVALNPKLQGAKPAAPPAPEPETFDASKTVVIQDAAGQRAALVADGGAALEFPVGGASLARRDIVEWCRAMLAVGPIDGKGMWSLSTLTCDGKEPRLLWSSSGESRALEQSLPLGEILLDYHAPSHRLLTLAGDQYDKNRPPRLTVWEVTPVDAAPKLVACWLAPAKFDIHDNIPWGKFISADLVVQRTDETVWTGWQIANKQAAFRIEQPAKKTTHAALSPGRSYLAVAGMDAVHLYAAESGKLLSTFPAESEPKALGFSHGGDRLAVAEVSRLVEWDITSAEQPAQVYQPAERALNSRMVLVPTKDYVLMFNNSSAVYIYSRLRQRETWAFTLSGIGFTVVEGQLLYHDVMPQNQGHMFGCVTLPPELLAAADAKLANPKPVVDQGQEVKVVSNVGADSADIQAMLEKIVVENGWKLSDTATTVITAERIESPPRQVSYQGFEGVKIVRETVTVRPLMMLVTVKVNGSQVWAKAKSSGGLPATTLRLKPGETIQSLIDQEARPTTDFFAEVKFPPQISIEGALGHSTVGNQGISPPAWR